MIGVRSSSELGNRRMTPRVPLRWRAIARTLVCLLKVYPMLPSRPLNWVTSRPVVDRVRYASSHGLAEGDLYQPATPGPHPGVVVCLGVVQHTPQPEETLAALAGYVKPGGLLAIDHYSRAYPATWSRRLIRSLLLRTSPERGSPDDSAHARQTRATAIGRTFMNCCADRLRANP